VSPVLFGIREHFVSSGRILTAPVGGSRLPDIFFFVPNAFSTHCVQRRGDLSDGVPGIIAHLLNSTPYTFTHPIA